MRTPLCIVPAFSASVALLIAGTAGSQDYPNKPIRIVTSAPGGGADFVARFVAQGLGGRLGQQVIVDNRGSGIVVGEIVAKAPGDGYTLVVTGPTFWFAPFLYDRLSWDPVKDFAPVSLATSAPNILVVHPSVAANTTRELIALARARPGELNYGSAGPGSTAHLAAELFKAMAGVNIVRINYKGSGQALNDLLGGQLQLMFAVDAQALPHIKSARLKALAITSAQPSELLPGLPTIAASGLPGYESVNIVGVLAPAKTPATIISRLSEEIARSLKRADWKEKFFSEGLEVVGSSPETFASAIKLEMARMSKVIKDAGIRAE